MQWPLQPGDHTDMTVKQASMTVPQTSLFHHNSTAVFMTLPKSHRAVKTYPPLTLNSPYVLPPKHIQNASPTDKYPPDHTPPQDAPHTLPFPLNDLPVPRHPPQPAFPPPSNQHFYIAPRTPATHHIRLSTPDHGIHGPSSGIETISGYACR